MKISRVAAVEEMAGRKYRPSNGTEGELFIGAWCCHCARDRSLREGVDYDECDDDEVCGIVARTFAHDVDAPEYPVEWQYDLRGEPVCTAFIPAGDPIPPPRCGHTIDMFGEAA